MGKLVETKPLKDRSAVERWMYFLRYVDDPEKQAEIEEIIAESEGIHMAMNVLREVSADEEMRARIRFQEKAERDQIALHNYYWSEGEKIGEKRGEQRGERNEKLAIAKKLLGNVDDEIIVQSTGLTMEELAALRKSL